MQDNREKFGRFGALMAMAGSAVGLGNLWRFPYLLGENGGAAFLLLYIVFAFCFALPVFISEFIIGRRSGVNCFKAFGKLSKKESPWKYVGLVGLGSIIITSYYSVVGGWCLEYLFKSCTFEISPDNSAEEISDIFQGFVSSVWPPLIGHVMFLGISIYIVSKGVKKGIESFGKIAMPALFVIVIGIAVYVAFLPGASEGYRYMFRPDFSKIDGNVVAAALGQSFFSMSLGVGCIMTYASYVNKGDSVVRHSFSTSLIDLLFAIIAGCAIMPAVFSFGVDSASGPSLVFETLPFIFARMPGGSVISILFFLALLVAALTSEVSMIEVVEAYLIEERKLSRKKASTIVFCFAFILGCLCSLSFGPLSGIKLFDHTIFDFCDTLTSNVLMTLGALFTVLFVGWRMDKSDLKDEFVFGDRSRLSTRLFPYFYFLIRYIAPLAILAIFISGIVS